MRPAVSEVAVIGVPSSKWGERPVALIVLNPEYKEKPPAEDEFRKYLTKAVEQGKIAKWWIPDKFVFVDTLPKTSVGKIDYMKLWKEYQTMQLP